MKIDILVWKTRVGIKAETKKKVPEIGNRRRILILGAIGLGIRQVYNSE